MIITLKQLKDLRACQEQVYLFEETFGESVEVTRELCLEHASDFDLRWFASKGFRKNQLATYEAAMTEPRATYEATMAEARAAYQAAIVEPRVAYETAIAEAMVPYKAAIAEAMVAYEATIAEAFYNASQS